MEADVRRKLNEPRDQEAAASKVDRGGGHDPHKRRLPRQDDHTARHREEPECIRAERGEENPDDEQTDQCAPRAAGVITD